MKQLHFWIINYSKNIWKFGEYPQAKDVMQKALSGYVSSNTTFRGTRCSVRCKYSDGRGLGTNTGLSSRRFYITPG